MNGGSQSGARTLATADQAYTHNSFADGLVRTVEARAEAAVAKARSVVRDAAVNAKTIAGDAAASSLNAFDGAARLVEGRIRRRGDRRMPAFFAGAIVGAGLCIAIQTLTRLR